MNNERLSKLIKKVVRKMADENEPVSDADNQMLNDVDMAIDTIVLNIGIITEKLSKVNTISEDEKSAIKSIIDNLETAINPYMADIINTFEKTFEESSEQ